MNAGPGDITRGTYRLQRHLSHPDMAGLCIQNHTVQLAKLFTVHRRDKSSEPGSSGEGLCLMINISGSPKLHRITINYLPREFTSAIISAKLLSD